MLVATNTSRSSHSGNLRERTFGLWLLPFIKINEFTRGKTEFEKYNNECLHVDITPVYTPPCMFQIKEAARSLHMWKTNVLEGTCLYRHDHRNRQMRDFKSYIGTSGTSNVMALLTPHLHLDRTKDYILFVLNED